MKLNCIAKTKAGSACNNSQKFGEYCGIHNPNKVAKVVKVANNGNNEEIKETITITFGNRGENNVGMQMIGKDIECGLTIEELQQAKLRFEEKGAKCELINLNEAGLFGEENRIDRERSTPAAILIIRNLFPKDHVNKLFEEQKTYEWDTKALMKGQVKNKVARHNVCYNDVAQEPDYINGKGRIIPWQQVPLLNELRSTLPDYIGIKAKELIGEGNRYYDTKKCSISFHGDFERKIVIAIRLGETMPLLFQWYKNFKKVGKQIQFSLNSGDMYIFSDKAVGYDWRQTKNDLLTLRHAVLPVNQIAK